MSWNPFKSIIERRRKRKEERAMMHTLEGLAVIFETLNAWRRAGLLYVDFKRNTVTIAQILAEYFLYEDKSWQKFLGDIHRWAVYEFSVMEYTRQFNKVKADAEAAAYAEKNRGNELKSDLTDAERKIARMRAVSEFDATYQHDSTNTLPDLQFVVLGIADGSPIIVARQIDGRYEMAAVPDKEEEE